jgi:thioredoxin-dependent peroxiredoxin
MMLKTGEKAPEFRLPTDAGGEVSLAELAGKRALLFFYPKADTPG